jgi:hypothetical protein
VYVIASQEVNSFQTRTEQTDMPAPKKCSPVSQKSSTEPAWIPLVEVLVKVIATLLADLYFPRQGAVIAMTIAMLEPALRNWLKQYVGTTDSSIYKSTHMALHVSQVERTAVCAYAYRYEHQSEIVFYPAATNPYIEIDDDAVIKTQLGTSHTFYLETYIWYPKNLDLKWVRSTLAELIESTRDHLQSLKSDPLRPFISAHRREDGEYEESRLPCTPSIRNMCVPRVCDSHMDVIQQFQLPETRKQYERSHLPYMLKYIISGPMGCGKSMFAEYVAMLLRMDIVYIDLDQPLSSQLRGGHYVYILNDIDLAKCGPYLFRSTCHLQHEPARPSTVIIADAKSESEPKPKQTAGSDMVLRTLCSFLDGQMNTTGCIVIASTNSYDRIDPILKRRFVHLEFGDIEERQWIHLLTTSGLDHPELRALYPVVKSLTINVVAKELIQPFMFSSKYRVEEHVSFIKSYRSDVNMRDGAQLTTYTSATTTSLVQ